MKQVQNHLTTIILEDGDSESLENAVQGFLDMHSLLAEGKLYARHSGGEVYIHPDDESKVYEITGPGGSIFCQSTTRWVRLKIGDIKYFIEFSTQAYREK